MEIFTKYNAKRVLNFCAGWGGSMVAAAALNIDAHYGIEINSDLKEPYQELSSYLEKKSNTKIHNYICDASNDFDYSTIQYETVFSSPPYYTLEKYKNNKLFSSKKEMDEKFYKPLFAKSYQHLQSGGYFIINVCKEVYDNVLKDLLGEYDEMFPLKKSKRQNDYTEIVYVWKKL
jgi:hypothetical protein